MDTVAKGQLSTLQISLNLFRTKQNIRPAQSDLPPASAG